MACGGSEAYRGMPLNVMYNDTFGWLSLSNSLYLNVCKIWGGRRTDMVWTPKPHTGWVGARNQLQILFTVRERQQKPGHQTMASEKRKKEQLHNLVYCKRAHFILVFLDVDTGTQGEAAARLQIQFHNMQFHTQFAVTKRPRTHETLAWLTPDSRLAWRGSLPPESCLGLSGASPTAAERDWRAKSLHLLSQKFFPSIPKHFLPKTSICCSRIYQR